MKNKILGCIAEASGPLMAGSLWNIILHTILNDNSMIIILHRASGKIIFHAGWNMTDRWYESDIGGCCLCCLQACHYTVVARLAVDSKCGTVDDCARSVDIPDDWNTPILDGLFCYGLIP